MNIFQKLIVRTGICCIVSIGAGLGMAGCDSYLNVNTDPTRPSQVSLAALLPSTLLFTSNAQFTAGRNASLWTQQLASQQAGGFDIQVQASTDWDGSWTGMYLNALTNLDRIDKQAQTQQSPYYQGIAKILQAINLGLATDTWENVPYSQAFQGSTNFTPSYDQQQQVYQTITTLLRDGITLLNSPTSNFAPGNDDVIYRGNRDNWRRLANSLLARYALHLSAKGASQAGMNALTALQAGAFQSSAQDFQFTYSGGGLSPILTLANETTIGRIYTVLWSNYLVSAMNANGDPRLPRIAGGATGQTLTSFVGAINGLGQPGPNGANAYITPTSWYAANPIQIMTFTEVKFIEAEARFLANGGTPTSAGTTPEARTALIDAITANMTKMGIPMSSIATYTAQIPAAASLRLSNILLEKHRAMLLNAEVWTDMRRWAYNPAIYTGLTLPMNHNPDLMGRWIQRAIYPQSEVTRNPIAFAANWQSVATYPSQPMWRDRP
jgi:hypothetical protein